MKKIIWLILLFTSLISYGKDINCAILSNIRKNREKKKYINLYTGRITMNIQDGKIECEVEVAGPFLIEDKYMFFKYGEEHYFKNSKILLEIKNKKLLKLEVRNIKNNKLEFLGQYGTLGLNGETIVGGDILIGEYAMKVKFKNGKIYDEIVQYYSNGKIYRISKLRNKDISLFDFNENFEKYVKSYEIYDYNTGEKILEENLNDGNGKIISYYNNGNKRKEYEISNNKINGKLIRYYSNGKKEIEEYYERGNLLEEILYNESEIKVREIQYQYKNNQRKTIKRIFFDEKGNEI